MTAIFVANGALDAETIAARFSQDAIQLPAAIRDFVLTHLQQYRAPTAAAPLAAMDEAKLISLFGNAPDKLAHLGTLFESEYKKLAAGLGAALSSPQPTEAKSMLHAIKGMAAMLGAHAAADVARRIEDHIAQRELDAAAADGKENAELSDLQDALLRSLQPYRDWFSRYQRAADPHLPPTRPTDAR